MKTLEQFAREPTTLPMTTAWYLTDLAEAKGRQALFIRQTPQRLKVLREHALIESAVSSNRIEGVTVEDSRIGTLMFGKPALHDRNEEEVKGYRDALNLLHQKGAGFPLSIDNIKHLHRLCRRYRQEMDRFLRAAQAYYARTYNQEVVIMLQPGTEVAVTSVKPIDEFRLSIRFSDGKASDVDFEPFLRASQHPDIRKFLNAERFAAYHIEWGNLVWGDYELCFPLESLYENAILETRLQAVAEPHAPYATSEDYTPPGQPE